MKSINIYIVLSVFIGCMLSSCEQYEDYVKDYDYSAVYFASQKPVRTIVARESMQFKFGVALGGLRENKYDEWVKYKIEPDLLSTVEGADAYTLLPEEYYTLSNTGTFTIPKGEFIGDVTLTLNKDLFTADPLAISNTYALPLRIYETSVDSILKGNEEVAPKDYTIIVVKYISPYHGFYYHKGVERKLDIDGTIESSDIFYNKDLSQNLVWECATLGLNKIKTSGISRNTKGALELTVNNDNTVDLVSSAGSSVTVSEGEGEYNPEKKEFYLDYKFQRAGGDYQVVDTLILRQDPELDLRFEEW